MNDFGLLVGRFFTALPTLTNTQLSELQLDSSGRLIIAGRFLEDSAHVSGDSGIQILAVRADVDGSLVDTDGDYTPLQVNADGRLKVDAELNVDFDYVYAEDTAHTSGDMGAFTLAVRRDVRSSGVDTDGDYASFNVNAVGELWVKDADSLAQLVLANASLDAIEASNAQIQIDTTAIRTEIESITHAEDSPHVSGHAGIMPLAVRNDAGTPLAADGDYIPFTTDAAGNIRVAAVVSPPGTEAYAVTDDLAAAGDGLATITAAATPWVTVASYLHVTGTAYVYGWQWGCDANADARIVTDDGVDVIVYKRSVNSSAQPSYPEHWSEGGRIEIAGATDLEIQLQIKKRSATGGNALGTGSLHIRVV